MWRTFDVENFLGDIVNLEGGWGWRQNLTQKDWPWMKESKKKNRELFQANVLGENFGHRPKGARASLARSDFVVDALEKISFGIL